MVKFYDKFLRRTFYLSVNGKEEANKLLKKLNLNLEVDLSLFGGYCADFDEYGEIFIYVKDWENTLDRNGTLIHEVSHAVDFIFKKLGINDTETRAYYTEYLYKEFVYLLVENNSKKPINKKK